MKRIIGALLCLCLLCCAFTGCKRQLAPHIPTGDGLYNDTTQVPVAPGLSDQSLTLACYFDKSLNPYIAADPTNRTLLPLMYQGLFFVDRNYTAVPILCREYQVSPDMKTYTFYLHAARFSDGTTLVAEDVVYSFAAAKAGSYYSGRFQHIVSVTESEGAVVIQLDTPMENLPLLLDIPVVKAAEVDAPNPLGTGAYYMDTALGGQRLRRQAAWWCVTDSIITAQSITLVEAGSASKIRDQFEFEDVGLVCTDPGSDSYADYRCDYELWDCENGLMLYLVCNQASTVFANEALRTALTHAFDRDYLVNNFYRGFASSATLPASPNSPYYSQNLASRYGYDSLAFTTALAETALETKEITFVVNSDDSLRLRVGRYLANQLREYGFTVNLMELTSSKFVEQLRWGTWDLYLGQTKLSANMDLSAFFSRNGSLNYGGLTDTTLYALCREALANRGNYYNLHEQVMKGGWICPLLFRSYAVYATRGLLTELTPARDNVFFYTTGRTLSDALIPNTP
jgi:peptide/nickel transport system substrate-binding protein